MNRVPLLVVVAGCVVWAAGLTSASIAKETAVGKQHVYFGTYTGPLSKGIYRADFDPATGKLGEPQLAAEATNPSFLNIHPTQKFLYAVNKEGDKSGGMLSFALDGQSGKLTPVGGQASCGDAPCHVTVDHAGKCVLVASYSSGTVAALPIKSDGSLGDAAELIQHADPAGSEKPRSPHAHSMFVDRDNKIAVAADLGLDQLRLYDLDADKAKLTPRKPPFITVKAGSGPRHFAFHPNGKFAYSNMELSSEVIAFSYDPSAGTLTELQTLPTLPADYKGGNSTAEILVHPSGKFAYVSNRGHNSIAMYAVDPETGRLTALGHQASGGKTPRGFSIDLSGQYLVAAHQDSDDVFVFKIDPDKGTLTPTGQSIKVGAPVCVKFVPVADAK